MKNIPLFWPNVQKDLWLEALEKVFSTRWIGQGPEVDLFEKEFGEKFDYQYCLSTNSGTAGLDLAYHLLDLRPGDEVIGTVLTCSASHIPLKRRGVNLIFADILRDKLTIDPEDIKRKITPKTKAIVVVNLGGVLVEDKVFHIAAENGIPVVVDACQSLGVKENRGNYIIYSFQAIKMFTTSDGGMLIVKNEYDYQRAKALRWFGIDREAKAKAGWVCLGSDREVCMDMSEPGYKYHMNDVAAAMGRVGLKVSDQALEHRRKVAAIYDSYLSDKVKCIFGGSFWLFGLLLENRDLLSPIIRSEGIECDTVHLRNDIFTLFGGKRWELPNMDWVEPRYLYIPIHQNMSLEEAEYVGETIRKLCK